MLSSKTKRRLKVDQRQIAIDSIEIAIPSPQQVLTWAERILENGKKVGVIKNSKTVNYKRFTPFRDGLFCERIFGPVTSFVCACGKKQPHSKVSFCEKCEVEYIDQRSRRYRLGYISLLSPVTHIWYLKGRGSYLSLFLGKRKKTIISLAYCNSYLVEHGPKGRPPFGGEALENKAVLCKPSSRLKEMALSPFIDGRLRDESRKPSISLRAANKGRLLTRLQRTTLLAIGRMGKSRHQESRKPCTSRSLRQSLEEPKAVPCNEMYVPLRANTKPSFARGAKLCNWAPAKLKSSALAKRSRLCMPTAIAQLPKGTKGFPCDAKPSIARALKSSYGASKISSAFKIEDFTGAFKGLQSSDLIATARRGKGEAELCKPLPLRAVALLKPTAADPIEERIGLQKTALLATGFVRRFDRLTKPGFVSPIKSRLFKGQNQRPEQRREDLSRTRGEMPLLKRKIEQRLYLSSKRSRYGTYLYSRQHALPFLPSFVSHFYLRDALLAFIYSSAAYEDLPLIEYCYTKRWEPLRDVHKFMAHKTVDNLKKGFPDEFLVAEPHAPARSRYVANKSASAERAFKGFEISDLSARLSKPEVLLKGVDSINNSSKKIQCFEKVRAYKIDFRGCKSHFFTEKRNPWCSPLTLKKRFLLADKSTSFANKAGSSLQEPSSTALLTPPVLLPKRIKGYLGGVAGPLFLQSSALHLPVGAFQIEDLIGYIGRSPCKAKLCITKKSPSKISFAEGAFKGEVQSRPLLRRRRSNRRFVSLWRRALIVAKGQKICSRSFVQKEMHLPGNERKPTLSEASNKSLLSGLELTAIREILSYTGGGALQQLLKSFNQHELCKFLFAESQILRVLYEARVAIGLGPETVYNPFLQAERFDPISISGLNNSSRKDVAQKPILVKDGFDRLETPLKRRPFMPLQSRADKAGLCLHHGATDLQKKQIVRLSRRIYKVARRLKVTQLLTRNHRKPEWMVLSYLPVLPPDLRPILQMSEKVIVASDLNIMYQRVIYRNNRHLRVRFIDFHLVTAIQRLVQDAVDRLIENGKGGSKPYYTQGGRPLKSLSDILKGKKGRFRLNLLGKRVDFSGRSVIVVSPHCQIHECGLPKDIALELYHYFLLRQLIVKKQCASIVTAKKMIKSKSSLMWDILRELMYHHPVLLNRAPTLHRLGIQAFQPKLVLGNAIWLHPLVCSGFNADFDGDQMGVHLPLSFAARAESWDLLWSRNNLLSPATGQPMLVPSQDMVLGFYYMTAQASQNKKISWCLDKGEGQSFKDTFLLGDGGTSPSKTSIQSSALSASKKTALVGAFKGPRSTNRFLSLKEITTSLQIGKIKLHQPVWLYWSGKIENEERSQRPVELRVHGFGEQQSVYEKSISSNLFQKTNVVAVSTLGDAKLGIAFAPSGSGDARALKSRYKAGLCKPKALLKPIKSSKAVTPIRNENEIRNSSFSISLHPKACYIRTTAGRVLMNNLILEAKPLQNSVLIAKSDAPARAVFLKGKE